MKDFIEKTLPKLTNPFELSSDWKGNVIGFKVFIYNFPSRLAIFSFFEDIKEDFYNLSIDLDYRNNIVSVYMHPELKDMQVKDCGTIQDLIKTFYKTLMGE